MGKCISGTVQNSHIDTAIEQIAATLQAIHDKLYAIDPTYSRLFCRCTKAVIILRTRGRDKNILNIEKSRRIKIAVENTVKKLNITILTSNEYSRLNCAELR